MTQSAVSSLSGPVSDLDPYDEEFLNDPFPALDLLRQAGPASYLPRYGIWAVTGHRDAHAILRDHRHYSSAAGIGLANIVAEPLVWRKPSLLLENDPPAHAPNRTAVVGTMTPRALGRYQQSFDVEARALVDELVERGRFDAVSDLAEVFPTTMFPKALGVDGDGMRNFLLAYGSISFNSVGPKNDRFERALEGADHILDWVAEHCRRSALRPDSLGAAVFEAADAAGIGEDDAASLIRSLFSAGVDTTVSALSFAVFDFVRFPDQWALVREDPSLARNAFEETVRFESPVVGFYRTATVEVTVGDAHIPAGSKVLVLFAGANHDPAQWENPNHYDVRRKPAGHLGYGAGPHVCAGISVARMEGETVIRALAERIESWELVGEPRFRHTNSLRQLGSLPVTVTAKRR